MDRHLILELARRYMSVTPDRVHSDNIRLRCPLSGDTDFHPSGDRGSLTFSVKVVPFGQSDAYCFRCHIGGSVLYCFEQAHTHFGSGFEELLQWLSEVEQGGFSGALTQARMAAIAEANVLPPAAQAAKNLERYAMGCHRRGMSPYLIERGLVKLDYERWKIGYDPETNRSTFPVWDHCNRLVGVSRRACGDEGPDRPKYHDLPTGRWKADVFYGEHRIDPTLEHAVLVEGVPGTVVASRWIKNVLGVLGSSTKIEGVRLEKLRNWAKVVTLLYDADQAGDEAVYGYEDVRGRWHDGLRDILRPYLAVRVAVLPPGGDPDSVLPSELIAAEKDAKSIVFDNGRASEYCPPPLPT